MPVIQIVFINIMFKRILYVCSQFVDHALCNITSYRHFWSHIESHANLFELYHEESDISRMPMQLSNVQISLRIQDGRQHVTYKLKYYTKKMNKVKWRSRPVSVSPWQNPGFLDTCQFYKVRFS